MTAWRSGHLGRRRLWYNISSELQYILCSQIQGVPKK